MFRSNDVVLIADDNKLIRTLVRHGLHQIGIRNIIEAEDGRIMRSPYPKRFGRHRSEPSDHSPNRSPAERGDPECL